MKLKPILTLLFFAAISLLSFNMMQTAFAQEQTNSVYSPPAEWDSQESIWLAWPQYEPVAKRSNVPQILDIIAAVTPFEYVDLIVNNEKESTFAHSQLKNRGILADRVRFHNIKHTDFWMRDAGAIFVRNAQGKRKAVILKFNAWGMASVSNNFKTSSEIDGEIASTMAKEFKIPVINSSLVMEGGGLEFNGKGTLIITKAVILQPERNPGLSKNKAEAELKRIFGVKKIIWLPHGIREDDSTFYGPILSKKTWVFTPLTTNGHTDEYVRWINDNTVLLAEVTKEEAGKAGPGSIPAITRTRLEENYKILADSTNQDNKPIRIIRIPAAEEIFETLHPGDSTFDGVTDMVRVDPGHQGKPVLNAEHQKAATFVSATSYLNYLVTNKAVLMPKYWKPGYPEIMRVKDEKAKAIIAAAFPERKIIQIENMEDINIGGGGIHCISQQMPVGI